MNIKTTEKGTVYSCTGYGTSAKAHTVEHAKTKSDVSIKGKTVQEVLQTGEKSLQAVLNAREKQLFEDGTVSSPTKYVIMFPTTPQSSAGGTGGDMVSKLTATLSPSKVVDSAGLSSVLGGAPGQSASSSKTPCNAIGAATMGFGPTKKGDAPVSQDGVVYDGENYTWAQGKNTADPAVGNLKYSQEMMIDMIINQTILHSSYPKQAMGEGAVDHYGMRTWWTIDTQTYFVKDDANLAKTGILPRVIVYRIMPYGAHAGAVMAPNLKPPGYDQISNHVVKKYDYIYTGLNTEIINFNIDFSNSFANLMAADNLSRSLDIQTARDFGGGIFESYNWLSNIFSFIKPFFSGSQPSTTPGGIPSQTRYTSTMTSTDKQGGGGQEDTASRGGRVFHDSVTNGYDMMKLELTIHGDPYWIAHSGMGNYTAAPTQYKDLNADGSVSYQNSEVDVQVNFRCPLDINQTTGLYNFGGNSKVAPVVSFSGLYRVQKVTTMFKEGKFTQELHGYRRQQQENKNQGSVSSLFNTKNFKG